MFSFRFRGNDPKMSGHSKWAQIKRQKGANDAKRGQSFTKLGNNISIAAKKGGGNPAANFTLRLAIDKARSANMPKENIERAIRRGIGALAGNQIEELMLEGFGPGKTAIIIEILTDNKNRTLPEIRNIFSKFGGQLASSGSVAYQFKHQGVIRIQVKEGQEGIESIEAKVIESGAQDYEFEDKEFLVLTDLSDLQKIKEYFDKEQIPIESAKVEYLPKATVELSTKDEACFIKLLEALDEREDIGEIYTNLK